MSKPSLETVLDTVARVLYDLKVDGAHCFDDDDDMTEIVSRFSSALGGAEAFETKAQRKLWEVEVLGR